MSTGAPPPSPGTARPRSRTCCPLHLWLRAAPGSAGSAAGGAPSPAPVPAHPVPAAPTSHRGVAPHGHRNGARGNPEGPSTRSGTSPPSAAGPGAAPRVLSAQRFAAPSLAPSFQIQGPGAEPPPSSGCGAAPAGPPPTAPQMAPSRPAAAGEPRPRGYVTSARRTGESVAANRTPRGRQSSPPQPPGPARVRGERHEPPTHRTPRIRPARRSPAPTSYRQKRDRAPRARPSRAAIGRGYVTQPMEPDGGGARRSPIGCAARRSFYISLTCDTMFPPPAATAAESSPTASPPPSCRHHPFPAATTPYLLLPLLARPAKRSPPPGNPPPRLSVPLSDRGR